MNLNSRKILKWNLYAILKYIGHINNKTENLNLDWLRKEEFFPLSLVLISDSCGDVNDDTEGDSSIAVFAVIVFELVMLLKAMVLLIVFKVVMVIIMVVLVRLVATVVLVPRFPKWGGLVGRDNWGKMLQNCVKMTKSAFLGQNSRTWGNKPIFWLVEGWGGGGILPVTSLG